MRVHGSPGRRRKLRVIEGMISRSPIKKTVVVFNIAQGIAF
jgi:hypothetical protein